MNYPTTNPDLTTGSATVSSTAAGSDGSHGFEASTGMRASTGNGHDRIHRFASTIHQSIDSIEQRLSSARGGMSSTQARYGDQARQYGDRLQARMNERPLQSAGIVLAAGVLLDRLFLRKPTVRVVQVPDRTHATWEASPRRTQRWREAADAHLQHVGRAGREAAGTAGMAAASGIAGTKAMASHLVREAEALPLQMRMAAHRLKARSQEYGSVARSTVEAHPWAGLGAVLAASGLLTTVLMRGRDPGRAYDGRVNASAWQRSEYDTKAGLGEMISSRPLASSLVVLGLGMLAGVMLGRRME